MTESAIQRAIGDYLEAQGLCWLDTSKPGGVVQRRRGLLGGFPDLVVVRSIVGLEVKGPRGKVSDKQRAFARYLEPHSPVYVVRSVEDARVCLRGAGMVGTWLPEFHLGAMERKL